MRRRIRKMMKLPILVIYRLFILCCRVNRNIIIFESNVGRNYSGNPRSIYEHMISQGLDKVFRCYYILEDTAIDLPGNVKKVKRISLPYFYYLARAGFWVSDTRMPTYLRKRKNTVYIQTWHGTPLKKLALDLEQISMEGEASLAEYKKKFAENTETWDYLISQNSYSTHIFRRAFAFQGTMLEIGYPRNDILFRENHAAAILELKMKLKLPLDKKLLLYAPTWRDNEHLGHLKYKFSSAMDYKYLKEALAEEYCLLVKAHYLVGEESGLGQYGDFLHYFDASCDIAELYLVSDMLITDYSSVMFDYSLLDRPLIFFTYDLEQYKDHLRGFYFNFLEEAPGPIVLTNEELVKEILTYNYKLYQAKYEAFKHKFNHADDGKASQKIVDLIRTSSEL
ncbi:MAG: CDP-glycerol glycerophosphotransferase family protein [Mobilitalea sp.]